MDHVYAATVPLNDENVDITPPPVLALCLQDHSFARPSSECPQASTSSKEDQSPRTRSSAPKKDEPLLIKLTSKKEGAAAKQKQATKKLKDQIPETKATTKREHPSKTDTLITKDVPLDSEMAVEEEQRRKTRSLATKDQASDTKEAIPPSPAAKTRSSIKEDQAKNITAVASKQRRSSEPVKMASRQDRTNKAQHSNTKQNQSPSSKKIDFKLSLSKKTNKMDTSQDHPPETNKKATRQQSQLRQMRETRATRQDLASDVRHVSDTQQDRTKRTRSSAGLQDEMGKKRKLAKMEDDGDKPAEISNGKDVEAAASKGRRGRKPSQIKLESARSVEKSAVKGEVKDMDEQSVVPSTKPSVSTISESGSHVAEHIQSESSVTAVSPSSPIVLPDGGANTSVDSETLTMGSERQNKGESTDTDRSPSIKHISQEKEGLATCGQNKTEESSSVTSVEVSSTEDLGQSQIMSEDRNSSVGDKPETADMAGREPSGETSVPDSHERTGSAVAYDGGEQGQDCPQSDREDGRIPVGDPEQSKHPPTLSTADDSNTTRNVQPQDKVNSPHSLEQDVCHSSAEPVNTDGGDDSKAGTEPEGEDVHDDKAGDGAVEAMDTDVTEDNSGGPADTESTETCSDPTSTETATDQTSQHRISGEVQEDRGDVKACLASHHDVDARQAEGSTEGNDHQLESGSVGGAPLKSGSMEADDMVNLIVDNNQDSDSCMERNVGKPDCSNTERTIGQPNDSSTEHIIGQPNDSSTEHIIGQPNDSNTEHNFGKPNTTASRDAKEDVQDGSSRRGTNDGSTVVSEQGSDKDIDPQPDNSELASEKLRRFCDAVRLKRKSPQADSGTVRMISLRKRTASDAGLNDSLPSSPPLPSDRSPSSSLVSIPASTSSSSSPARQGRPTGPIKRKASVPKAGASDLPHGAEKFKIPLRDHGWKRELVVRGVYDEIKCKYPPADVYYFTPEGMKLRSGVKIATYLSENPSSLTTDNFTFMKKSFWEEPWETVRHAGNQRLGRKKGDSTTPKSSTLPKKKAKMKITKTAPAVAKKRPVSEDTPVSSPSQTISTPVSTKPKFKHSYVAVKDDDNDLISDTDDDEDYDPRKEDPSPAWNKRRSFFGKRKGDKPSKPAKDHEVLIQSIPEPEIIIDRADESFYAEDGSEKADGTEVSIDSNRSVGGSVEQTKPPRMMLLPADIKEECSDGEGDGSDGKGLGRVGTVHIHHSPEKRVRSYSKPTARKSTMPRIALKKPSSSKATDPTLLAEGQLCSNACPGLNGVAPSLQCSVCMCLFHHQCVNINPAYTLSGRFKCLRCKDVATSQSVMFTSLDNQPSVSTPTFATPTLSTPTSTHPPPPPRVIVLQAPLTTPTPLTVATPLPSMSPSLMSTVPSPLMPVTSDCKTDAIQMLRNLTSLSQPMPTVSTALPVRPAPPTPPQLVPAATMGSVRYCVLPPLQARPPPRLKAAPGVLVSTPPPPPPPPPPPTAPSFTAFTVLPPPASQSMSLPVPGCPQPQMMTLPVSLLNRLNLSQPLAVKLNNAQVVVPPSCLISSKEGLKVLLPPSTFPIHPNSSAKLAYTVSNNVLTTATPTSTLSTCGSGISQAGSVASVCSTNISPSASVVNALYADSVPSGGSGSVADIRPSDSGPASQVMGTVNVVPSDPPPAPRLQDLSSTHSQGVKAGGGPRHCKQRRGVDVTRCAIHRLHGGFDCMLAIFKYLSVPDLLRAGQVCRSWQKIAQERCLWQKVNLKGLRVRDWGQTALFLNSVRTQSLNLQKVQPESVVHRERMRFWDSLRDCVNTLTDLRRLEFGLVPAYVLHSIADTLMDLEALRAEHISDFTNDEMWTTETKLDVGRFGLLSELQELRLRGVSTLALPSFTFSGSLSELASLKHLHTLSLTSVCALRDSEFSFLEDMKQLKVLELGDCLQWTEETYKVLGDLCNLHHLRLECGGEIPDCGLGNAMAKLTKLRRLELILFTIPASLSHALKQLPLLDSLVVWPDAYHGLAPALINSHALTAVVGLPQLTSLEWGVVIRPATQDPPGQSTPPAFRPATIPLLKPGATLDPEVDMAPDHMLEVSINDFTQKLLLSLPKTTSIKVFNTQNELNADVGNQLSCLTSRKKGKYPCCAQCQHGGKVLPPCN